jgi:hypothetical protein
MYTNIAMPHDIATRPIKIADVFCLGSGII